MHKRAQIELETGEEYDYEKGGVKKKNLRSELTELVVFLNWMKYNTNRLFVGVLCHVPSYSFLVELENCFSTHWLQKE